MQHIDPKCTSMLLIERFRMTQAHLDRTALLPLPLYRASYPRSITPHIDGITHSKALKENGIFSTPFCVASLDVKRNMRSI